MLEVTNQDALYPQDSYSIPKQTTFDQKVSYSFPEFGHERKRCRQDQVSHLENSDIITFTSLFQYENKTVKSKGSTSFIKRSLASRSLSHSVSLFCH